VAFALALTWVVIAQEPASTKAQTADGPVTVNVNLGVDPPNLDPALSTDTSSINVIEQLFIGLVDLDDETSEIRPELATTWTVSADSTVYTFTLRNDVFWSDGNQVTAQDVRYGILRSLDPATESGYAYTLYIIRNAEEYHTEAISDPDQVGVTAVDTTTLRVTFEHPASYALSILSLWVARPMPKWAIEAHGVPTWTEPANIVTNGPYRLTEWVHDDHILLTKDPTYYDAANVDIDQVKMWMVDDTTALQMYRDGQMGTTAVPIDELDDVKADPLLSQQLFIAPRACTYYYGFSISQEPFDDPLVRKAFAAATNRRGLIDSVTGGGQQPALTYTPPGLFGHVDGYAEDVGIPYDPTQARQWLSDAGYPDGQGLPEITLWFNESEGHQSIAEYIRDSWYATLGVSVTLNTRPWGEYLDQLPGGEFQVWRLGWCMDYPDANNFLNDGIDRSRHGKWNNATYEDLLDQAAREQDPGVREDLYKQAEEILVETDAVMLPLYYYTNVLLTKPYLERTHGDGFGDIATWRITQASTVVETDGGELTSDDGDTNVQLPSGAVTDTVVITHTPATGSPPGGNLNSIGNVFDLTAVYSDTRQEAQPAPGSAYTVTTQYSETQLGPTVEDTLGLYWWDEGANEWSQQGITSSVNVTDDVVAAQVAHFSRFAVLGETHRVYLPVVLRKY
jgi:oligopeptide transport system substrate-binding protein